MVKKFKSKDGNAPQLAKNDIVEIEEMIAESKLWRVRFQETSFLVPKATLKLLGPEEAMKLAPKRKAPEPQRKPATATASTTTTSSSSSSSLAAAVSMTVTTSTAAAGASAPVKPQATASFVAAPPKADDEKAETTATSPAPATPTASAATAKEGLQELLAQREREYAEAERAMDAKIAELEAAAAKREAALRMLEEKLAQARRLEEVYGRLTEQTRALRNAHERNLAYKREAEGLAVRVRITAEAKNEKPPSELTAEDLAF